MLKHEFLNEVSPLLDGESNKCSSVVRTFILEFQAQENIFHGIGRGMYISRWIEPEAYGSECKDWQIEFVH